MGQPTYAGTDGADTEDETLCPELDPNTGEYAYSLAGACTTLGLCIGLDDINAEDVVAVVNTPPVLFLLG